MQSVTQRKHSGVYILLYQPEICNDKWLVKIGKATKIKSRISTLNSSHPKYLSFKRGMVVVPEDKIVKMNGITYSDSLIAQIERMFHHEFREHRNSPKREFFEFKSEEDIIEKITEFVEKTKKSFIPCKISDENETFIEPRKYIDEIENDEDSDSDDEETMIELYEHQSPIVSKMIDCDKERFCLELPTGFGKSILFLFYLKITCKRGLILSPRISIKETLEKHATNCGVKWSNDMSGHVVIQTYQFIEYQEEINEEFDIIILDEAHHLITGEKWRNKVDSIKTKQKMYVSATLSYIDYVKEKNKETESSDDDNEEISYEEISDNGEEDDFSSFSEQYETKSADIFGNLIYKISIEEAIDKHYICPYRNYVFLGDYLKSIQTCIDVYKRRRIIVFFSSVAKSKEAAKRMKENGMEAYHVDYETKFERRQRIQERFESDHEECIVLCNHNIYSEGCDYPMIDTVVFADKRDSLIGIKQIIGRGLRRYKRLNYMKTECMVVLPLNINPNLMDVKEIKDGDGLVRSIRESMNTVREKKEFMMYNEEINQYSSLIDIGCSNIKCIGLLAMCVRLDNFIKENGRRPKTRSKNKNEKIIGRSIECIHIYMKKLSLIELETIKNKFSQIYDMFINKKNDLDHDIRLQQLDDYIKNNGKHPSEIENRKLHNLHRDTFQLFKKDNEYKSLKEKFPEIYEYFINNLKKKEILHAYTQDKKLCVCGYKGKDSYSLKIHITGKTNIHNFKCCWKDCVFSSNRKYTICSHIYTKHLKIKHKCLCKKEFTQSQTMLQCEIKHVQNSLSSSSKKSELEEDIAIFIKTSKLTDVLEIRDKYFSSKRHKPELPDVSEYIKEIE